MSKRQSTIQSFFHTLGESRKKQDPDNNADNKMGSGTENKCPNGASLKNKSNDEHDRLDANASGSRAKEKSCDFGESF